MGKKTMIKPESVREEPNPRLVMDERLRRHGFAIFARPASGEPIWVKEGKKYLQTDAVKSLPAEDPPVHKPEAEQEDDFDDEVG
jgi:hypothetical protein